MSLRPLRSSAAVAIAGLLLAASCSSTSVDNSIGLTAGVDGAPVAIVDNCPPVNSARIEIDGTVLWAIERSSAAPSTATVDIAVGGEPAGWSEAATLTAPLVADRTYLLITGPEPASISFRPTDLEPGVVFYGGDRTEPLGTRSDFVTCDEVAADDEGINSFGDLATTFLLLALGLIVAVGLIAWLIIALLRRVFGGWARERYANEPELILDITDEWDDADWDAWEDDDHPDFERDWDAPEWEEEF